MSTQLDAEFVAWCVKTHEEMSKDATVAFLSLLTSNSPGMKAHIVSEIINWSKAYTFYTGKGVVVYGLESEAQVILEALKQRFVTQPVSPQTS